MKNFKSLTFGVLFVASCAFLSAQSSNTPTTVQENLNAPEISFENLVHDYGTMKKGADGKCVFTFTNNGKEPLILGEVRATCGCTTPGWTKDPVLPGKSGEIVAVYDTNRMGEFSKTIIINSNAKTNPVTLTIKGTVVE
jgi:hypothetical protein